MMEKRLFVVVGLLCSLLLCSCDETTAPDPCAGSTPVRARFTMYETLWRGKAPTDTVLTWNLVVFAADEKYDSYEWRIGEDPRTWSDSTVALHFQEAVGDVAVRLIARRAPNHTCFPEDDGIDTLTKVLHVVGSEQSRVVGFYHGYNTDAPRDTFTFSLQYLDLGEFGMRYVMNNLNRGCTEPAQDGSNAIDIYIGYSAFHFSSSGWMGMGCDDPNGLAVLLGDSDSIRVDYVLRDRADITKRIAKTFVGRRVQ